MSESGFKFPERPKETIDQKKERLMPVFQAALDIFNDREQPIEKARINVTRERANGQLQTIEGLVVFFVNGDGPEMAFVDDNGEPTASATMLWSEIVDAKLQRQ